MFENASRADSGDWGLAVNGPILAPIPIHYRLLCRMEMQETPVPHLSVLVKYLEDTLLFLCAIGLHVSAQLYVDMYWEV